MNQTEIEPDWGIIKLNEYPYWCEEVQASAEKAYGVFAFDRNSRTYCCEATPSYCLFRIGTDLHPVEGLSEEQREELNDYEIESDSTSEEVCYMHTWDVDEMIKKDPTVFHPVSMEDLDENVDPVDDIREGWYTGALTY